MQCDTEKAMNGDLHHGNVHIEERVDDVSSHYSHSTAVDAFLPLANGLNSSAVNSENNGNLTENGDLNCNGVGSKDEQSSKKSRRVTFPDNENVVQSYLNPPDPWKHGKSCTTEILLQAYHKACERFNVKPNSKLLNQLYVITNFVERNDTLSLRGEKVDLRQIETLEEIFKRVQFRTLDLENTYLDEEGAIALFEMVEYYESAIRLNISGNRTIGFRGWQACSRMLKRTPSLVHLEARGCLLVESNVGFLSRPIRMGCFLKVLHLENTNMSGKSLLILGTALKMNDMLSELYLGENKLTASDGIQLGNIMKHNSALCILDLRNNSLQDVGVAHLCDGLCDQTGEKGLRTLVLFNNQLTYQAMSSLAKVLVATNHLRSLNVGHNAVTNEGIHRLKESLLVNKVLTNLSLQSARISCEGAVALAEYIAESRCLQHMDLRENEIKTAGLMALALSLKVNRSVTRIDLDKDPKKEGMKDFADQQRRLLQDIITCSMRNAEALRQFEWNEAEKRRLLAHEVEGDGGVLASGPFSASPEGRFYGGPEMENDRRRLLEEEVESVCTVPTEADNVSSDEPVTTIPAHLSARERLSLTIPSRSVLRDLASSSTDSVENSATAAEEVAADIKDSLQHNGSIEDDAVDAATDIMSPSSPYFVPSHYPLSPMVSYSGHPVLTPLPNSDDMTPSSLEASWADEIGQLADVVNDVISGSEGVSEKDESCVNRLFVSDKYEDEDHTATDTITDVIRSHHVEQDSSQNHVDSSRSDNVSTAIVDNMYNEANSNADTDISASAVECSDVSVSDMPDPIDKGLLIPAEPVDLLLPSNATSESCTLRSEDVKDSGESDQLSAPLMADLSTASVDVSSEISNTTLFAQEDKNEPARHNDPEVQSTSNLPDLQEGNACTTSFEGSSASENVTAAADDGDMMASGQVMSSDSVSKDSSHNLDHDLGAVSTWSAEVSRPADNDELVDLTRDLLQTNDSCAISKSLPSALHDSNGDDVDVIPVVTTEPLQDVTGDLNSLCVIDNSEPDSVIDLPVDLSANDNSSSSKSLGAVEVHPALIPAFDGALLAESIRTPMNRNVESNEQRELENGEALDDVAHQDYPALDSLLLVAEDNGSNAHNDTVDNVTNHTSSSSGHDESFITESIRSVSSVGDSKITVTEERDNGNIEQLSDEDIPESAKESNPVINSSEVVDVKRGDLLSVEHELRPSSDCKSDDKATSDDATSEIICDN